MKTTILALALATLTLAQDAPKPASPVKVTKVASPKALKFEVLVPGKLDDVWAAFTTTEGLNTWLWQDCSVELRPNGDWIAKFPGGSIAGGTIVSFQPKRQVVIHAMAPEKFPTVRSTGTTATFDFKASGDQTLVTLTQTGWQEGKEWDDAYEYLATGNAQLLGQLHYRFAKGPIAWK
jgi:uncharacterized protein YndB with AHSA1/START domain